MGNIQGQEINQPTQKSRFKIKEETTQRQTWHLATPAQHVCGEWGENRGRGHRHEAIREYWQAILWTSDNYGEWERCSASITPCPKMNVTECRAVELSATAAGHRSLVAAAKACLKQSLKVSRDSSILTTDSGWWGWGLTETQHSLPLIGLLCKCVWFKDCPWVGEHGRGLGLFGVRCCLVTCSLGLGR